MEHISLRRCQGGNGVRWLVTIHTYTDHRPAPADRPDITFEVPGEQEPHVEVLNNQLWINGRLPDTLLTYKECEVPHNDLLRKAFEEQRRAVEHNQLVQAVQMIVGTVAIGVAAAFFTIWRLRIGRC